MNIDLRNRLETMARLPVLLVASDFDGTLSPLVNDPSSAAPDPRALAALAALAKLDHTHAAIVSGRGLTQLKKLSGSPSGVALVGSHGAEHRGVASPSAAEELLARLAHQLKPFEDRERGLRLEFKPFAVAFHYRGADPADASEAIDAILAGPAAQPGVKAIHGSMVLELAVSSSSKVAAVARLRHETGATGVIFVGDDPSDEETIRSLGQADLGIRVGAAATAAFGRAEDVDAVADILELLLDLRQNWLATRALRPLERFSILSDQRTLGVVDPRGRLSWLSAPRVDSSAIFSDLLGGSTAGYFDVLPSIDRSAKNATQRYEGNSFTLITEWDTFRVVDYLDCSGGRPYQRAGRGDLVRVVEGDADILLRFAPRLDFGRLPTRLVARDQGIEIEGAADPLVLFSPGVNWTIRDEGSHQTASATVRLIPGAPLVLELRFGSANLRAPMAPEPDRRQQTQRFWSGWASSLRLPSQYQDIVRRSALVLKALCYGPTGAFVAAATTSLPEQLGGVRNWDYRFCWPRDSSLMAASLLRLGNTGHALKLLDWLAAVVDSCESPDRLHPIYTVSGGRLPPEAEVTQLSGYAGSRPVRISNAASNQVQLDVFGPIVDLVALLAERGAPISPDHWRLVRSMVTAVERRWRDPDHGIWEVRMEPRHHVHSRTMCWHTVSRALRVEEHVYGRQNSDWMRLADEIRADVLKNGWNEARGCFTGAYGHDNIDAATLLVGLTGLISPDDERFERTVEVINTRLRAGGGPAVFRYLEDDGLPGREGGMLICTGWLIEALHLVGRKDEARELFEQFASLVGPTGIATEQYCPQYKIALGNLAQGYTHLSLINSAVILAGGAG